VKGFHQPRSPRCRGLFVPKPTREVIYLHSYPG
jgi:hypothetical protein